MTTAAQSVDVVLRGGETLRVRPVRSDDEPGLVDFLDGLSPQARAFRFFSGAVNVRAMARNCASADGRQTYGLVALAGRDGAIVAHAMYAAIDESTVEVAFAIADALQGHGLGTILLAHLAGAAHQAGYSGWRAEVMAANARMLEVFQESGFATRFTADGSGTVTVQSATTLDVSGLERYERRDHDSAVAAVRHVLSPASIALVGASRSRESVGGAIFHNLLEAGFTGSVYPVNRSAESVQGVRAYPSVKAVGARVELAVVAVPADAVLAVARDCADAGVAALVVISAGFGEAGADGVRRHGELMSICREAGIRVVGPNCLGVLATAEDIRMNATFARRMPPAGPLALMSQSGALGLAAIDQAAERGIGLASFVSAGNKADISGNDLIQYWHDDPCTGVIALYLESFGNARKFARIAPKVAETKPVVVVKSGRSRAGARAAASHTGAVLAASDLTVDALFRQAGVVRAETLAELLDSCALLGTQPLPRGPRVAVLTNSGGPGILAVDALESAGMTLAELSPGLRRRLQDDLPAAASVANPVDMLATADGATYRQVLESLADEEPIDAVVVIYTPTGLDDPADVLEGVASGADCLHARVPVLAVALTPQSRGGLLQGERATVPLYAFPEDAVRALEHAWRYAEWRARPRGAQPVFDDLRPDVAAGVIAGALAAGESWLSPERAELLLASYGIAVVESRRVSSAAAAGRAARELGGRVALKAVARDVLHKSEAGAVRLSLEGITETTKAARAMQRKLRDAGHAVEGFVVQRMADPAPEVLVGVASDEVFGPVVVCAAGGTAVELLGDTAARITPLTDLDAHDLLRSLKTFPLLDGWRGAPRSAVADLEQMLLRISALVEAHAAIVELDLNPVVVGPDGALAVDHRVRVAQPPRPRPWPSIGTGPAPARQG